LNEVLRLKFRKLHETVVDNVNPASIIDFLFQEEVIKANDMRALLILKDDPEEQSSELLALLHTSEHAQAFIQLYLAIKEKRQLKWLIKHIDSLPGQSLIAQQYISDPAGE